MIFQCLEDKQLEFNELQPVVTETRCQAAPGPLL